MELRHLRYFIVLAEELNFTRAAERLHIEQSPLSRVIKDLEEELGTPLFHRGRRGSRLTTAGDVLLTDARQVLAMMEQMRKNVRAIASGYRGVIRIAISDGAVEPRLSGLLARLRADEPELEVRMSDVPLSSQLRGLRDGHFDVGLALSNDVGKGIVAEAIWVDPLLAVVPLSHPLLAFPRVPLHELVRHPLVLCDPAVREGCSQQITRFLRAEGGEPIIAEYAGSIDMMLIFVAAGYGVGFVTDAQMEICRHPEVAMRPVDAKEAMMTTYLLQPASGRSELAERFVVRLHRHALQQSRDHDISP